jgi:hypothetical protein
LLWKQKLATTADYYSLIKYSTSTQWSTLQLKKKMKMFYKSTGSVFN